VLPRYRTLWISDLHLGTRASRAADLLDFLSKIATERIYLVGDILDLDRINAGQRLPDVHRRVISRLLELAGSGTEVRYIPGNHDGDFRRFAARDIAGIPVAIEDEHETASGRKLLVMHGDALDGLVRQGTSLGQYGARAYRFLMRLDVAINRLRSGLDRDYWPISAAVKKRIRLANEYIERFEETAARYASSRGYDGIVCGHIHKPCVREISGVCYANDGDWVEHRSALAETADGALRILHWEGDSILITEPSGPDFRLAA
jgi:UDP-2,3-diacylglucosamine pyrophosphatase LpxH